jgi:outer membrane protein TolC
MAIAESLENNLQGKMAKKEVEIADKEVRIAKANILPQVSIGGSAIGLSENLVEASMGQKGAFTLTGSASIKQVIFSESVFANIAIQKLMAENKKFFNQQKVLDVVSNSSVGFISLLFTKSNLLIQNENVNTTMKNLQMAKAKEEAGQTGVSDVNRWITELNMNKMKFNDTYTSYRSNMYQINQILNSEINSTINISDSNSIDKTIFIDEKLIKNIFENPILTDKYASFVIEEMKNNSPELHQLEAMADIIDRKSRLYKRQWFMPELVAFGGADQAFIREGTIMPQNMPVPPPPDDMTFNYGLSLKIPIFQGGKASAQAAKSIIELDKITFQKEELMDRLEVGIRSAVQKLRTSYLELELSENAADAAEANFKMVQDAYFQGAADLIKLIDAQNVMIRTKQMANISYYQYVLDYIVLERYQAKFTFLSPDTEKEDYINRLNQFLLKR